MAETPHLAGITVLDLSSVGPASRCSRILADYGATVVKVGPPPRKSGVQIQPPYWSYSAGRGMRRLQIDLKAPDGRAAFLRLAAKAQVVIESFRPGVAARMGIGWEDVRALNPRVVYCSTSGYGQDGPYARWAGHDLNYLAVGGYLAMSGRRGDGGPALPGATVADSAAGGMHAAIAILAALVRAGGTGEGEYLDVSVAAGVLWLMSLPIDQHLATGETPAPGGDLLSGRYACYDVYAARDGRWLAVAAIEPAFFANLCNALGLERWIPHQLDDARQDEIRSDFRRAFAERDRGEWVRELSPRDTCIAPVNTVAEVVEDPHFRVRGAVVEARHVRHGSFRQLAPVLAGAGAPGAPYAVGDATAAETEELLRQVGVSGQDIEKMRREGVVHEGVEPMELTFSQEQQMLRDTVRGMLAAHAPVDVVRAMEDDAVGYPAGLWKKLAELGLLGLTLPERYGGADLSTLEAAILYEEMGRALAPSPHFVSAVMSAGVLAAAGSQAQRDEWLPKIVAGDAIITPAWLEPQGGYGPAGVRLAAVEDGGKYKLRGTKRHVAFARAATRLLVLACTGQGERDVDLFLVDPSDPRVDLVQQHTVASDTQYQVTFDDVPVAKSERIGAAGSGWETWDRVMHDGIILLAAQAIGGAERALDMTVDYAKMRKQFDKPLGAFQAIAHYLADAVTQVDGGKTLVYEAAWARSTGRPIDRLAPMAKLFACQTFRDVTAMAEQVHGGLGFTVEFDIQLYFRRAKQLQLSWWDSRYLEELVAASVLDAK